MEKGNIDPNFPYGAFLKLLTFIERHQTKGINIHVKYIDNCAIHFGPHGHFFSQTANLFQYWNYTKEQLRCFVDISTGSYCLQEDVSPGVSQSSNLNTNEDNDDNND